MRVLYVDLEREWRGGQSQALLTLRGLRERGHEVELLTAKDSPLAIRAAKVGIAVRITRLGCGFDTRVVEAPLLRPRAPE
jgi:hypothetical protein